MVTSLLEATNRNRADRDCSTVCAQLPADTRCTSLPLYTRGRTRGVHGATHAQHLVITNMDTQHRVLYTHTRAHTKARSTHNHACYT
jgi:hypothetical protein